MKKRCLITLTLLLFFSSLIAFATPEAAVVSGAATKTRLYATLKDFGTLNDPKTNNVLGVFEEALKEEFSFEWCENRFDSGVKTILSRITGDLSGIMPIKNIAFSELRVNDLNASFRFILNDKNDELKQGSAVMSRDEYKILALSFDKS